ncbi:MAG: hypothetical protein KJ601_01835 [Nanoarchaeota archaeon]|nr:hypothetical protein [Nanoarchaeota archaeon]MBU1704409.1 hypothetical protein [Nanoarchaeota archaeon]
MTKTLDQLIERCIQANRTPPISTEALSTYEQLMRSDDFAIVIQCGGRGRRADCKQPKPLALLVDGDRPLSNVMQDVPKEVPFYLHLLAEQKPVYVDLLSPYNNFGHRTSFILQSEDQLYDAHHRPMHSVDGLQITASNGSVTFIRHFVKPPKYIALVDGAKFGVYFPDIINALHGLVQSQREAMVFARRLSDGSNRTKDELAEELANYQDSHTRFARINQREQRIYEHPCMPRRVVDDPDWLALAGIYIVDAQAFAIKTRRQKGQLMEAESINSLYEGFAHHLKTAMTLIGYNNRPTGLEFLTFEPTVYIPGYKNPKDKVRYEGLKKGGTFFWR